MSESDLTPWFDGNTKPVRVGVYQQRNEDYEIGYQRWDGQLWYSWHKNIRVAETTPFLASVIYQNDPWRGLAKDPNAITPEEAAQRITDKINEEHASGLDGDPEAP